MGGILEWIETSKPSGSKGKMHITPARDSSNRLAIEYLI
jgi:hypothetical protein